MQTVLVVDDDESVRDLITVILEVEGFTTFAAATGEEALAIAARHHVDVVTIDLLLPGMSGAELAQILRDDPKTAGARQMIISGAPQGVNAEGLVADAILSKPFDFNAFVSILRKLMAAPPTTKALHEQAAALDEILRGGLVFPVFQPIVDLTTGRVVGIEGLARGPMGPLHEAQQLFQAAHRLGRLHELDTLCRLKVLSTARDASPLTPPLVFVNAEPGSMHLPMSEELMALLLSPLPFCVVVEFTERALTRRVPALLRHAEEIRERGNVVALDDLGVDPGSLAVLPLVQPEIIKLDMSLLAAESAANMPAAAATATAAAAYAERSGAIVIAEGIENEEHLARAIGLGAQWGQGHLFGRPGPISELADRAVARRIPQLPTRPRVDVDAGQTPFGLAVATGLTPRLGERRLLLRVSQHLEQHARQLGDVGVLLAAIQQHAVLSPRMQAAYAELAASTAVLGVLGVGVPPEPFPRAYGVDLDPDEPLAREWVITVLGPHVAVVLAARQRSEAVDGGGATYDFVLSYDWAYAHRVGRLLTRRLVPRAAIARTTALPQHIA
jgi:EAL domain-containing protein (putative c-di-GMP-specific phosphodiesterase class I)/ActR/RegA family two-component response regulator